MSYRLKKLDTKAIEIIASDRRNYPSACIVAGYLRRQNNTYDACAKFLANHKFRTLRGSVVWNVGQVYVMGV